MLIRHNLRTYSQCNALSIQHKNHITRCARRPFDLVLWNSVWAVLRMRQLITSFGYTYL